MSHFQTAGQAAYSVSKPATWPCQTNGRNKKRVQIIRYKKSCRFKKDFWAVVHQAGCFISLCLTPIAFSTTCPLVHVVEKAIGVTHIEIKHPAWCTTAQKSFLNSNLHHFLYLIIHYSIALYELAINHLWNKNQHSQEEENDAMKKEYCWNLTLCQESSTVPNCAAWSIVLTWGKYKHAALPVTPVKQTEISYVFESILSMQ